MPRTSFVQAEFGLLQTSYGEKRSAESDQQQMQGVDTVELLHSGSASTGLREAVHIGLSLWREILDHSNDLLSFLK